MNEESEIQLLKKCGLLFVICASDPKGKAHSTLQGLSFGHLRKKSPSLQLP
jgi:ribosomal protein L36